MSDLKITGEFNAVLTSRIANKEQNGFLNISYMYHYSDGDLYYLKDNCASEDVYQYYSSGQVFW